MNEIKKENKNQIKNLYNYLALFATLMMIIGGGIGVFMSLVDIIFPEPHYQTFDEYRNYKRYPLPDTTLEENIPSKISDTELRVDYNEMLESNKNREVVRAQKRLFKSFAWLLIPLPFFFYFQKRTSNKKRG